MKKSVIRAALCSSATIVVPAIPAAMMLPAQAAAQTVCTGTLVLLSPTTIECVEGATVVATGETESTTIVNLTAQGLSTTSAGDQTVTLSAGDVLDNTITTDAAATPALSLTSAGALTLTAADVNAAVIGAGSNALVLTGTSIDAAFGDASAADGSALVATSTGPIDIDVGDLSGGGGSDVALVTGGTGAINLTTGTVMGDATADTDGVVVTGTGPITVATSDITLLGDASTGVEIVGGAEAIALTTGSITTSGASDSNAIYVSGTGPITVDANGALSTVGTDSEGLEIDGGLGAISASFGDVTTTGAGSEGVDISGLGTVTVAQDVDTSVTTTADATDGVVLVGEDVTGVLQDISASGAGSAGLDVLATDDINLEVGDVTASSTGVRAVAGGDINLSTGDVSNTEAANGVELFGDGVITYDGGQITTQGDSAFGVFVNGGAGPITLTTTGITTTGDMASGVVVADSAGDVTTDLGTVTTAGDGSIGLLVQNSGTGTVTAGFDAITTAGIAAPGVEIVAPAASVVLAGGDVTTTGATSNGVIVTADVISGTLGDVTATGADSRGIELFGEVDGLVVGDVSSTEDGIVVLAGADPINLTSGDVSTTEDDALAVLLISDGAIDYTGGQLSTSGDASMGLIVDGGIGPVTVTTAGIDTTGDNAPAAVIDSSGDVTTDLGVITTAGLDSDGLVITNNGVGVITAGFDSITTAGTDSTGLNIDALTADVVLAGGDVTTLADATNAVEVDAASIGGTLGDVSATGTGSMGVILNAAEDIDVVIGDVTSDAEGVTATAVGDLDIVTGNVATLAAGAEGLTLTGTNVTAVCGNVSTAGDNAIGVDATATATLDLTCATISTTGDASDGAVLVGNDIVADLGTVTTDGLDSDAVVASATGDLDITADTVATLANGSSGLVLSATNVTAVCGSVSTAGNNSIGVDATATALLDVTCATVSTTGDASDGVVLAGSDVTADLGSVTTDGIGSDAILATADANLDVTVDSVTTLADDSDGIVLTSDNTVLVCGDVSTAGMSSVGIDATGTATLDVTCASVATSGDDSDAVLLTGGTITGDIGDITASGAGSLGLVVDATGPVDLMVDDVVSTDDGITINAGGNDVTLACGAVSTSEANANATTINSTGTIDVDCGVQSTIGDNSIGLDVNGGADPITVVVAGVSTEGDGSVGVDIDGSGSVDFTNEGDIDTGGVNAPGVIIGDPGTPVADADVDCGNVHTTGDNSPAVTVIATGRVDLVCGVVTTEGDLSDGITVDSVTGPVTVTGGTTTTGGIDSDGIVVTTATGPITINTGTVDANGDDADGVIATAAGCAPVIVNVTNDVSSDDGTAVIASSACDVTINQSAGAPISGGAAGIEATSGTGTTINLNDTVLADTGLAIDADGAAADINIGATGRIVGRVDLTDNDDTIDNAGIFQAVGTSDFGLGVDVFNNLAGGEVNSFAGNAVLGNCETFNNAGTINMIDGAANDTMTVCTNYVGSGEAALGIDVGGADGELLADMLIVPGNVSGSTDVNLNVLASGAVVDPDGVMIVDAGTATGTPFALGDVGNAGLIDYALVQEGADTFLVSTINERVFEVARLNTMGQDMWYQSADAFLSCAASRRNDFGLNDRNPIGVCAQLYGSTDRWGDDDRTATVFGSDITYSDRTKTKRRGAQVDLGFSGGMFQAGLTAGYSHAKAQPDTGTEFHIEGHNIGAYAQFGMEQGFYAGLMAKRDKYDAKMANATFIPLVKVDGKSTGIDGEVGYRTTSWGPLVDINAGLSHVRTKFDDFVAGNIAFDADSRTSTRGRIGVRAGWAGMYAPFIDAKLFHEFSGDNDIEVTSGPLVDTIHARGRGTWGRIEAGLGGAAGGGPLLSIWTDLGDVKGWGIRGGFRF